jgi:hypothetical protein
MSSDATRPGRLVSMSERLQHRGRSLECHRQPLYCTVRLERAMLGAMTALVVVSTLQPLRQEGSQNNDMTDVGRNPLMWGSMIQKHLRIGLVDLH